MSKLTMNLETQQKLIECGAEKLAEALMKLSKSSDAAGNMIERLTEPAQKIITRKIGFWSRYYDK